MTTRPRKPAPNTPGPGKLPLPELEDLKRRKASYDRRPTDPVAKEINALLLEIAHFGVDVKDPDQGLIDFPAVRRGREVLLCWKLGEDEVRYWHGVDEGFAGRKPLLL